MFKIVHLTGREEDAGLLDAGLEGGKYKLVQICALRAVFQLASSALAEPEPLMTMQAGQSDTPIVDRMMRDSKKKGRK